MLIEELCPGINLEDENIEFKGILEEGEDFDSNGKKKERKEIGWLKVLASFANTWGGTLYVGVENNSHNIIPLDHNIFDRISLMVQRLIKQDIEPPISYKINKIEVPNTSPIRYLMTIVVEKSKYPPISLHESGKGTVYCRHFGKTSVATGEEIRAMVLNSESVTYDSIISESIFKKEDFKTLYDTYSRVHNGKELSIKELISIGFMLPDHRLSKGALLFKDNCSSSNTIINCTQFLGVSKGDDTFYATETFSGNLLSCYEKTINFVSNRIANGFIKKGDTRVELVSYPKRALMEAIINALGHRNYFINESQIEINLFKDRLEIISPGSLIGRQWLKHETNLSTLPPVRRNPIICNVFMILNLMEEKGSGFDKIVNEYKGYSNSYLPFADSDERSFTLTLADLTHPGGIIGNQENPLLHTSEDINVKNGLNILSYCYNKPRTVSQIAAFVGVESSTYFRKNILGELVKNGYLIEQNDQYPILFKTNPNKVIID